MVHLCRVEEGFLRQEFLGASEGALEYGVNMQARGKFISKITDSDELRGAERISEGYLL